MNYTITITDETDGVLVSLRDLLRGKLSFIKCTHWALRGLETVTFSPTVVPILEMEKLSSYFNGGLLLKDSDFRLFVKENIQIVDGSIVAMDGEGEMISLECFDSTFWEITSQRDAVIQELGRLGALHSRPDPTE